LAALIARLGVEALGAGMDRNRQADERLLESIRRPIGLP